MAVASPRSTETLDANPDASNPPSTAPVDPSTAAVFTSGPSEAPTANASMPIPNPAPVAPPPPAVPSFAPSFRPLGVAPFPQYSAVPTPMAPNPSFQAPIGQAPGIQPPGVSAPPSVMPPGSFPTMRPGAPYQVAPGQPPMAAPMHYGQVGNGYATVPPPQAPMGIPPGMPRYPSPYPAMIRPGFPMRPILPTGMVPQLPRPPIPNIRGVPPVVTPVIRPVIPLVAPAEKPQTTVYVGKIAATVENEFLLSILTLCGPVKSWKRAQDPSDGKPKGFGFCEYETAEGVLRSLRLLSKLNIDGQELVVNIKQATREYLERYVEKKKTEKEKLKEAESGGPAKENDSKEDFEKQEPAKPVAEETEKQTEDGVKENHESNKKFGIVTDEDREADRDALEKLTAMIEERMKNKPLPLPVPLDGSAKSTSEVPSKSRDGDSDVDIMRSDAAEDKIDEETTSENKPATESDKPETGSPDRSRRHDRSKERDRDRDSKREKERELERVERDRERDRIRRDREREMKLREAERLYKERLKEWEGREREKEYHRQYEKDREKERERERRKEIMRQEEESSDDDADDSRKKRRRSSFLEERKRKRKREKEEDLEDRLKEEEEIVEAKRRAAEEQQLKADLKSLGQVSLDYENPTAQEEEICVEEKQSVPDQAKEVSANGINNVDVISRNNSADDLNIAPVATSDTKQSNAPARKLGFGLIGSGKRTTVPSVFHEEDDAEEDEKKMRPLVPIDYSTEELQAVQTSASGPQANLAAAAEFAKRISGINTKEEKSDGDRENRERSRRSTDKLNFRERDRNDDESNRHREESREKLHERNVDKEKSRDDKPKTENKKLLDAKQLIDMIPKTKEELFVYEIDWDIYDKHQLHERMRPWISKKITEFLGEEEATLVDYIVSCIKDHVQASTMLEMLQSILDDEAEMFVLKMWRMLIFEIKKIETGLAIKSKS